MPGIETESLAFFNIETIVDFFKDIYPASQ